MNQDEIDYGVLQEEQAETAIAAAIASSTNPAFNIVLPNIKGKKSAQHLAEEINSSNEAVDALIYILDRSSSVVAVTNKFYLTGLQMTFKERAQLLETFSSSNISFFGDSIKVYHLTGIALDYASQEEAGEYKFFHQSSLMLLYNELLRGSQLIQNKQIAVLKVLNHTIYGYPLNLVTAYSAPNDKMAQFSISWLVTQHTLDLQGVVTEKDLQGMYSSTISTNPKVNNYLASIAKTVSAIDTFLNFGNALDDPKTSATLRDALNSIGLRTFNGLTLSLITVLNTSQLTEFKNLLKKNLASCSSILAGDNSESSPIIKSMLKDGDKSIGEIMSSKNTDIDLITNAENFEKLLITVQQLSSIKKQLLIIRSRLIG
jgi:hypothetical protein